MRLWFEKGWSERRGEGQRREEAVKALMEGKGK